MAEGDSQSALGAPEEAAPHEDAPDEDAPQEDAPEEHFQCAPDIVDLTALRNSLQKQLPKNGDYKQVDGITKWRDGKFKAYTMIQGFSIDTWLMPRVDAAWTNRTAMNRVKNRVCTWLHEDRPAEETITDGEFAAFLRGVLEEVRASTPKDLVAWVYHTEIKLPPHHPAYSKTQTFCAPSKTGIFRAKTQYNLADALRSWRRLRQELGIADSFNVDECVGMLREEAEEFSQRVMSSLRSGGYPTDEEALSVLRLWSFNRNETRANVIPQGEKWVRSETLGLVIPQGSSLPAVSKPTEGHETVFRLLRRWVQGHLPDALRCKEMPCTSMSLNKGYAAKLHRDGRNEGPSVGASVGDFKGGMLMYWPSDDGRMDLELLRQQPHIVLDTKASSVVFDGNLGHAVEQFSGERFSIILFTCPRREKASPATRRHLKKLGVTIPSDADLLRMRTHLPGSDAETPKPAEASDKKRKASDEAVNLSGKVAKASDEAAKARGKAANASCKVATSSKTAKASGRAKRAATLSKAAKVSRKPVAAISVHKVTTAPKSAWMKARKEADKMHPAAEMKERVCVAKRIYARLKKGCGLAAAVKEEHARAMSHPGRRMA